MKRELTEFDKTTKKYYAERKTNNRVDCWSDQITRKLEVKLRSYMGSYVNEKRLNRR